MNEKIARLNDLGSLSETMQCKLFSLGEAQ